MMLKNSLHILLGEDDIRADEFISNLKKELDDQGISYESETIDWEETEISTLVEKLLTTSLFVEKKILILKNCSSLFSDQAAREEILPIIKRIAPEKKSPILIIAKVVWSKEIEPLIKKEGLGNYITNLYRGKDWAIKRELREKAKKDGYIIDEDALSLILDYTGEDYTQVYQEYEKAKLYTKSHRITRKDLEEIISPTKRFPIQELGTAFRNRDRKKALLALQNLYLYSGKLEAVIGYLVGILFHLLAEERTSLWDKKEIVSQLKELAKIDKKIKTTNCDGETMLTKWVTEILK